MSFKLYSRSGLVSDLLLPDICAVCGCKLTFQRTKTVPEAAICGDCMNNFINSRYEQKLNNIIRCSKCGYPLTSEVKTCLRCRDKNWNFDRASSLFLYEGIVRKVISAYKFNNLKSMAALFSYCIYHEIRNVYPGFTIIPVPSRPAAKRKRGWDQMVLISKILAKKYRIDTAECLRRLDGPAQKTMNYEKRLSNLSKKIFIKKGIKAPQRAVLIDDVFTTGATMDQCAKILKEAGTSDVFCIAIALDL